METTFANLLKAFAYGSFVAACHGGEASRHDVAGADAAAATPPLSSAASSAAASAAFRGVASTSVPFPPPPTSETYPFFRKTTLSLEDLAKLVNAVPALARIGTELAFFDPQDGSYIVRSSADRQGVTFTTQPVLWSPEQGQQVLVVSARGKAASFVAAWWVLPDGGHRLATTFVMMGEIAPVALAYRSVERTLYWTSCWQCPGETGHLSVREDHHVVIVQD
jgi:hypothetical protein